MMIIYQNYAFVDENSIVQNIAVVDNYEEANRLVKAIYGEKALAVDVAQWACKEGDIYRDSIFYRIQEDGSEVMLKPVMTQDQEIGVLREENNQLLECVVENDYRLSMMELGL